MALGSFISVGRSLEKAHGRVEHAERLGYEATFVIHLAARDSQAVLMAYAARTERIRLGTGVLPIYSRTPVATMTRAMSERFLESLAAIGEPEQAREAVTRYREAGATLPSIGAIPRTDFDATLDALAGA